mmetsp:Transcript_250/g.641  ORF Transcript_250/g.641 Transcript_250/m.641 type:complete len:93 (+) Transcript_250:573-851(+)
MRSSFGFERHGTSLLLGFVQCSHSRGLLISRPEAGEFLAKAGSAGCHGSSLSLGVDSAALAPRQLKNLLRASYTPPLLNNTARLDALCPSQA